VDRAAKPHAAAQDGAAQSPTLSISRERSVSERDQQSDSAFQAIRAIDYTVIFVRDMPAMRRFY
jgi:hypothetical protein